MDRQCKGTSTRSCKRCKRTAIRGGFVCPKHGGAAPQVKAKAAKRLKDMLADAIDPNRVLRESARIAYSDIRRLFDANGRLLPIKQWPEDTARAVAGVEVVKRNIDSGDGQTDDVIKLRLWDKVAKLTNLMKHHGQLTERLELTGAVSIEDRILAGRNRVANAKR